MADASGSIDSVMQETRLFPPPQEFAAQARIGSMAEYETLYEEAKRDPVAFWDKLAKDELHWFEPYTQVLNWNVPVAEWFVGGKTNASYNCLDRHLERRGDKTALLFEPDDPNAPVQRVTYRDLHARVCRMANALRAEGVKVENGRVKRPRRTDTLDEALWGPGER